MPSLVAVSQAKQSVMNFELIHPSGNDEITLRSCISMEE